MKEQTKKAIKHGNGGRVPCLDCCGHGAEALEGRDRHGNPYPILTSHACPTCNGRGTVLYPLRVVVQKLVA